MKEQPMPHIARFPEEPPLEGAPKNAEESILLNTPELATAANAAVDFGCSNSEKRRQLTNRLLADAAQNPRSLEQTLDAIAILKESGGYPAAPKLENALTTNINKIQFKEFPPAPQALERWLTMLSESALYAPLAQNVLKRMVERCQDSPKAIIGFLYNLSLAGLTSSNHRVMKKTLEILAYQNEILPAVSTQGKNFLLASFHTDDEILRPAMEIDHAFFFLSKLHAPELIQTKKLNQQTIEKDKDFQRSSAQLVFSDRQRMGKLLKYYSLPQDELGLAQFTAEQARRFPVTLNLQGGPLRHWFNDRMAQELSLRRGERAVSLHFPSSQGVYKEDDLPALILQHLQEERPAAEAVEDEPYWTTLSYLTPVGMESRAVQIETLNEQICQDMLDNTRYLLSPRGDLIEIIDPTLKELGFKSVLYEMDPRNKRDTIVTIAVANARYRIMLDEHFALRHAKTLKPITLPSNGTFIQNILLSHLREIRCSEKVNEVMRGSGSTEGENGRRAFTSRRAHLRRLPTGQSPTQEQIRRALEIYDIDITRINREAAARGEAVKRTFVFDAENVAISGKGPVRSQTPDATRSLHKLLDDIRH